MIKSNVIKTKEEFNHWLKHLPFDVDYESVPEHFPCVIVYSIKEDSGGMRETVYECVYLEDFK